MSNPKHLEELLTSLNLKMEIILEQTRELDPNYLNLLADGTKEYILELHGENKSLFEIINDNLWKYEVWMKEAYKIN